MYVLCDRSVEVFHQHPILMINTTIIHYINTTLFFNLLLQIRFCTQVCGNLMPIIYLLSGILSIYLFMPLLWKRYQAKTAIAFSVCRCMRPSICEYTR